MEKVDFIQKPIELAQSSQYFIESLWEIGTEVSKLCAPLTSVFSSFFGFLVNIIDYQTGLHKSIQEFNLTRFELLFPYYIGTERLAQREAEYFPAQTGKLEIPLLLNFSIVRAVSELAVPLAKEPSKLIPFPKPQEPEITAKVFEKQLAEAPQKTLVQRIVEVRTQLWSRLTPSMKNVSSTLLEYERQKIPLTLLAATSKPVLLDRTGFAGLTPYRFVTPLEEEKVKPSLSKPPSKEIYREPPAYKAVMAEVAPSGLTAGITLAPEALMVFSYATKLPSVISEKQTPFLKIAATISRISSSPPATSPSIEPPYPLLTSWIHKGLETLRRTRVSLSALPVATSAVEKLVTETLIQPIPSLEAPWTYGDHELVSQSLSPTELKPTVKHFAFEAFRLPSILTSLIAYHIQTHPLLSAEPRVSQIYEAPFEIERLTAEQPATPSEISEVQKLSKLPVTLALAATAKLITQRRRQESATFMKEIQISRSTYARVIADLGAAGPIRATMLGELAAGLTIPYTSEPYTPTAQPSFPYTSESYLSTVQPVSPQPLRQIPTSQNAVNVTVFAETPEEDLRELERKISMILSEQLADLGAAGPIRATMLGELAAGLTIPYTSEPYTPKSSAVSQQQLGQSPTSQDAVNVTVFAETPEEDLRELERKIRNILSEQISRYYGSSRI